MSDGLAYPPAKQPMVEVIIPVHREERPVERAVASVLDADDPVRVIVVAHNMAAERFRSRLQPFGSRVHLMELQDGISSPAGPLNLGLDSARAHWVTCMGSDDFYQPGSAHKWVTYLRDNNPDVVILPAQAVWEENVDLPATRPFRRCHLDPAKDRLFYRTGPLMLARRSLLDEEGIRMTEGLRTGEDLAYSSHLFASASTIDLFPRGFPFYVVSNDGGPRITGSLLPLSELVRPSLLLSQEKWVRELSPDMAKALTVRIIRDSLIPAMYRHVDDASIEDIRLVGEVLRGWLIISPMAIRSLSVVEERLCAAVLANQDRSHFRERVQELTGGRRRDKVLPRHLSWLLERDTRVRQWAAQRIRQITA